MKQHINIVVTILIGVLIAQCYACSRDRIIVDQGQWTKISSFEDSVVKDTYALIDGKIYYGGFDRAFYDSVLCSRPEADLPYLKEADVETFEVCENSYYARDAHHVYAPLQLEYLDGEKYGGYYAVQYIIKNADHQIFKIIRNNYAVSGHHMYYEGKEISWRDEVLDPSIPINDDFILLNEYK